MLELRPTCEHCNRKLLPDSTEAMICTFECTFCKPCVEKVLRNVCPNCGGGFCPRPIRPSTEWRKGIYLGNRPASTKVVFKPVEVDQHKVFSLKIKDIPPERR